MGIVRKVVLAVVALALLAVVWVWWNRPERVDMAAYVPADSIIYAEANSLPDIVSGLDSTSAWRELAPAAGVKSWWLDNVGWLSRLAAWTGLGRSEQVVLSRAQVALTVLGFEAAEEPEATLKISPRAALVAETHTGEGRARAAVEKLVGDFARRTFGSPSVERKEVDGTPFVVWSAPPGPAGKRRKLVAAVSESVAVVGNDEAAVQACLAVKRGERGALAGSPQLEEMRERVGADGALAFGFAPTGSAARLVEILAPAFVSQLSAKPNVQSLLASQLPQLTNRLLGGAAWSSRAVGGQVEDRYYVELPDGLAGRLQEALVAEGSAGVGAGAFLPAGTHQVTRYNYRDPEKAWRGLNAAVSSQVDPLSAPLLALASDELLKPYGIEKPREFLRAAGPAIATARLEVTSARKVLVVAVRNEQVLRELVRKRLGAGARAERVGDAELLVSPSEERGAAAFVAGHLLMGDEEDVRRCLAAHSEGRTLERDEAFQAAVAALPGDAPQALTLTDYQVSAAAFISYLARRLGARSDAGNRDALAKALTRVPYSVSETRLAEGGFEKTTRSAFGQFGALVERLAQGEE